MKHSQNNSDAASVEAVEFRVYEGFGQMRLTSGSCMQFSAILRHALCSAPATLVPTSALFPCPSFQYDGFLFFHNPYGVCSGTFVSGSWEMKMILKFCFPAVQILVTDALTV
jgi:hypothetical protein